METDVNNKTVKKTPLSVAAVKNKINELVGKNIAMQVCRGRKQVKNYQGVVETTYPSVFVVKLNEAQGAINSLSYSYSDVVCGEVTIAEI